MNYIGEYIRKYRGNMSLRDFADKCGISHTHLDSIEKGIDPRTGKPVKVTVETLKKIAIAMNMTINDLLIKSGDVKIEDLVFDNAELVEGDSSIVKIPVYGTIKAGIPIESQSDIIEYVEIPKEWIKGGKKFYGLKISGDSMFPKYSENDIVIFEQNDDHELYNGKDVAVMINGTESTFKKILVNEQGIVLQPYNVAYDIMMFSKEQVEQLPIKVVGIAREKRTKL